MTRCQYLYTPLIVAALAAPALADAPRDAASNRAQASVTAGRADELRELPPLTHVLALAAKQAPAVALSEANVTATRAARVGARLPPLGNPVLTAFAEHGSGVTEDVYVEGQLDIPLEIWGQRRKRIAEVEGLVALAQAGVDVARASALGETANAYGQAVVASERVRVLQSAIEAAQSEAAVYQARVAMQDATMRDAHVATMEVARLESLMIEARADLASALAALSRLTGLKLAKDAVAKTPEPPDEQTLIAEAHTSDDAPVVRESRAEAEYFARASKRAASEGRAPFGLLLRGVRGDMAEARFGAGFSVGFPFFRRNQGERARAAADAERARRASEIQEAALSAAAQGLERELEQLREARRVIESTALPAAREAVEAAQQIHAAGKGELLPVLISRRDYASLHLRRLDILARQWRAVADLITITGLTP